MKLVEQSFSIIYTQIWLSHLTSYIENEKKPNERKNQTRLKVCGKLPNEKLNFGTCTAEFTLQKGSSLPSLVSKLIPDADLQEQIRN